jgi:hypothetical protein
MTKLSSRDKAIVVTIENLFQYPVSANSQETRKADLESLSDFLLRIGVFHLSCHHGKEFCPNQ